MKKKAFTLIEVMVVILILGILVAVVIPLMSTRINLAKDANLKTEYFSSEQFKKIVNYDGIQEGKDAVGQFQDYLRSNDSYLHLATAEDVKKYLGQSVEDPFNRKLLDGLLEFKGKSPYH